MVTWQRRKQGFTGAAGSAAIPDVLPGRGGLQRLCKEKPSHLHSPKLGLFLVLLWDAKFVRAGGGLLTSQSCDLHSVFPKETSGRKECLHVQPKAPYPGSRYGSSFAVTRCSPIWQQTHLTTKWQIAEPPRVKSCSLCPLVVETPDSCEERKAAEMLRWTI